MSTKIFDVLSTIDPSYVITRENITDNGVSCKIYRLPKDEEPVDIPSSGRIFYNKETNEELLYCPEYKIVKYYVNNPSEKTLQEIPVEQPAVYFSSNDGPLLFIYKVNGNILIQSMRECLSAFEESFKKDFEQLFRRSIESLYDKYVLTSEWCYVFRYGPGVLSTECDEVNKIIYCGFLRCKVSQTSPEALSDPLLMTWEHSTTKLSSFSAVLAEWKRPTHNFVSVAFEGGECQIFGDDYLYRVCVLTGYKREELVSPAVNDYKTTSIRLVNSQFPPILNIFNLYILCGVDTLSLIHI